MAARIDALGTPSQFGEGRLRVPQGTDLVEWISTRAGPMGCRRCRRPGSGLAYIALLTEYIAALPRI
jgi:hypothetical protein